MKLVLLSGGSGKRLWPLSNESRSKQFLKVLSDDNGERISMVQRVWSQLGLVGLQQDTLIATGMSQKEMIQTQLGYEADIVIEPERRDTFSAIALSAVYLYSILEIGLDETVMVLPVDPYVENRFFEQLHHLEAIIGDSEAEIGLIGVQPTYPSEKYGYIVPKQQEERLEYRHVSHFEEKPRESRAQRLIEQSALWNCGVFAFKLGYLIYLLIERGYPIQFDELQKQYHKLPSISFDYEIVEKAERVVVLPYDGYWKDLGTWNTLTEEMDSALIGNGIVSSDCDRTHVINELGIPVTVLGVSNIVVAVSPDGILVADKEASPRIKEVMKHNEQRPMYEERRWGRYRVIDYIKYDSGKQVLTKRIQVDAGCNLSYQYHLRRDEIWTVIEGEAQVVLDNEIRFIPDRRRFACTCLLQA